LSVEDRDALSTRLHHAGGGWSSNSRASARCEQVACLLGLVSRRLPQNTQCTCRAPPVGVTLSSPS
jgi:hypothetical protein